MLTLLVLPAEHSAYACSQGHAGGVRTVAHHAALNASANSRPRSPSLSQPRRIGSSPIRLPSPSSAATACTLRLLRPSSLPFVPHSLLLLNRLRLIPSSALQGIRDDPHDEPTKAGGDLKGRQPPK